MEKMVQTNIFQRLTGGKYRPDLTIRMETAYRGRRTIDLEPN